MSMAGAMNPGRRSLRELALGWLAQHLRCAIPAKGQQRNRADKATLCREVSGENPQ
jgi:hypothetical protein